MDKIQYPTEEGVAYKCDYHGCCGNLKVEKRVVQNRTGDIGLKLRCENNFKHKYFVVVKVGRLIRVACGRWEKPIKYA